MWVHEGTGLTQKRFPKFVQFLAMLLPQLLPLLPERFTGALLQDELGPVGPAMCDREQYDMCGV